MTTARFIVFLSILTIIFSLMWHTVWKQLISSISLSPHWHLAIKVIFIVTLVMQFLRWMDFRNENPMYLNLAFNYFIFGFFVYLFMGAILFLISKLLFTFNEYHSISAIGIIVACFFINIVSVYLALAGPEIKKVSLGKKIPFRIAQISDLHVGPMIKKEYVQKVVHAVNSLNADAIVITGDIGDGSAKALLEDLEPLRELKSRLGVYYVTGNHEYYWNVNEWIETIKKLGFHVLQNEGMIIDDTHKIYMAGVPDYTAHQFDPMHEANIPQAMGFLPAEKRSEYFKILLAHQPKAYSAAKDAGFNLLLSGHTHRGQFFPISLIIGLFNPYTHGMNSNGSFKIYVNAGTGFWGPPLRLGVASEITCLDL